MILKFTVNHEEPPIQSRQPIMVHVQTLTHGQTTLAQSESIFENSPALVLPSLDE